MKLDMSKTYDQVKWNFSGDVMNKMRLCDIWIDFIMSWIESISFSILLNGMLRYTFKPKRGLQQRGSLYPIYFYFVQKVFLLSLLKMSFLDTI